MDFGLRENNYSYNGNGIKISKTIKRSDFYILAFYNFAIEIKRKSNKAYEVQDKITIYNNSSQYLTYNISKNNVFGELIPEEKTVIFKKNGEETKENLFPKEAKNVQYTYTAMRIGKKLILSLMMEYDGDIYEQIYTYTGFTKDDLGLKITFSNPKCLKSLKIYKSKEDI